MRRPPTPSAHAAASDAGFTLLEMMVVLAIFGVVLAIGVPSLHTWIFANKVTSAGQFYTEGFALARSQALTHNSASRLVFEENAANGQFDWQVDICFPRPEDPCTATSNNWSTPAAVAAHDPEGAAGFKSVLRRADVLPKTDELATTIGADGVRSVHFTPLGWVDPAMAPQVARIDLVPSGSMADAAPASAIVLTLAGLAIRCKPGVAADDRQRCPP